LRAGPRRAIAVAVPNDSLTRALRHAQQGDGGHKQNLSSFHFIHKQRHLRSFGFEKSKCTIDGSIPVSRIGLQAPSSFFSETLLNKTKRNKQHQHGHTMAMMPRGARSISGSDRVAAAVSFHV
jgi:hypothetical protein